MTTAAAPKQTLLSRARELADRISEHNVVVIAAGIAFYGLLALIPTLVAIISVYALVTDPAQIASQISDLTKGMERDSAALINDQLANAVEDAKGSGVVALLIGIVVALWAASGALQKLMNVIALAYEAIDERTGWKVRLLAYGLTAGGIVTVALMGFVFGALPNVLSALGLGGPLTVAVSIGSYIGMLIFMVFAFTVLYRYSPDRSPKTPWRNPGAVVGALMLLTFAVLFSLYFTFAAGSMPASYGILGSIAAIIIFLQLTAIAIVIGAEVNSVRETPDYQGLDSIMGNRSTTKAATEPTGTVGFGKAALIVGALIVFGRRP